MNAKKVLTIGIDYRVVRGGVAAVENVYSTFYQPFNHVTTTVTNGQVKKLLVLCKAILQFLYWMLFHPEIKIVHVQGSVGASFWRKAIFIYIAKFFHKQVVWHMHAGRFAVFYQQHRYAVKKVVDKSDVIIALSEFWKEYFKKEFPTKRVEIIKNVISAPKVHKQQTSYFTLLFLGLLGKNKGIYDLLECIRDHKEEFQGKLKLYIGGNGEIEQVKQLIKEYGIADIVMFEGWISGDKKIELLNNSDAYILPSYKEGLPISILEAMSYGMPIISTPVGGIPEIVSNGENGYLVEPGNKEDIYKAIISLLNNTDLRNRMGNVSLSRVGEHLPEYVEKQLETLYGSLVK